MATQALGNRLVNMGTKIVAVGRNYAAHAKELGNAVPKEPIIFLKPTSSYLRMGGAIEIPRQIQSLDHEVELGVVIGKEGRDISLEEAMDHVSGYLLALDMTAREIQASAKGASARRKILSACKFLQTGVGVFDLFLVPQANGMPWTAAKGYDTFTPISDFILKKNVPSYDALELWLQVDGVMKQKGSTGDMMFSIPFLIKYISSIMTLKEGDLILTGTPSGVGPVKSGQKIKAGITGVIEIEFLVKARPAPIR